MVALHERIEHRIRDDICKACIYQTAGGGCNLHGHEACPVVGRINEVIGIVRSIKDDKIDPYAERLRAVVCAECRNEDAAGHCKMRDHADCPLDDYFVLLVQIVEEELAREPSADSSN